MNMLSFYPSRENRPLKKSKLGPPDVYGQDGKQREDELSDVNLRIGFKYSIPSIDVKDDSASALADVCSLNPTELQSSLQTMMINKNKQESYLHESLTKKRPAPTKEHFQNIKLNVNENKVATFFQDLIGAASLHSIIQKKVLVTILKEDVFEILWQHMVPLDRASWFIKMNNAHQHSLAEKSRRKTIDPSNEWTQILKDFVANKFKQNHVSAENRESPQLSSSTAPTNSSNNGEQLQYLFQLCFKLYQDGLLDKQFFLRSLIESLEQKKSNEAILAFLPLLMLFVEELLCSQSLSRSLADFCIRRLRHFHDTGTLYTEDDARLRGSDADCKRDINILAYSLTIKLSAILHSVVLECPLALIWLPSEQKNSFPLDKLPIDLTSLPILPQPDSNISPAQICILLSERVQELRERRKAAEMRWSSVGIQASSRGAAVRELVDILDNLNTFKFTDVTSKTRLLVLYRRVFHSPDTLQSLSLRDETIILLLCQWAVSADQVGRHRPLLVAGLIWARQKERVGLCVDNLLNEFGEFEDDSMETCSLSGAEWTNRERFPFQRALIQFLDRNESVPVNKPNSSKNGAFLLLCILFSELIQRDLFSFEQYLKFLVARGDFGDSNMRPSYINKLNKTDIKLPDPPPRTFIEETDVREEDMNCSQSSFCSSQPDTIDLVAPSHVKEHLSHVTRSHSPKPKSQKTAVPTEEEQQQQKVNNTYHYVVHFPAPDCCDRVEAQRATLLYGIGATREYSLKVLAAAKEQVINFAGGKLEQSRTKHILKDFQNLPICIQQEVSATCAVNYKRNKTLSLPKFFFVVELLDLSGSVSKLIEFLFEVIVHMQGEESMKDIHPKIDSPPTRVNKLQLSFRMPVVSILQAYLPSLLASAYHTSHIFERLTFVFEKIQSPDHVLRSDQMRVFLFLNQLYQSCFYLMDAHKNTFGPFQKSLEHTTHSNYQLNSTDMYWERNFRHNLELDQHPTTDISSTVSTLLNLIHKRTQGYDPFSLICELYAQACNASTVDTIRDLAHILVDVCSECPSLNNMFMEAVRAICAPSTKHGFKSLHQHILPYQSLQHNKLVIFIVFVVFHNPLLLPNLVDNVMIAACQYHRSPESSEHQSNALDITCLLILSILTEDSRSDSTKSAPPADDWHPVKKLPLYVKRFLYVQNQQLPLSSVSELLKQMIQLLDSFSKNINNHRKFSKCLEAVISQSWVREKCQCEVEQLAQALTEKEKDQISGSIPSMGSEPKLKPHLVKLLTSYICYQGKPYGNAKDDKSQVIKILESLDLCNLRFSLIQLFVLLQLTPQQQRITDTISQSAFDVFSQKQEQHSKDDTGEIDIFRIAPAWLVAPLVSRLPSTVHGRILKLAGDHSKGEWWSVAPGAQTADHKEGGGSSGKQQPFLELVLACLHSGSQEELLDPLSKQLTSFLDAPLEEKQPSDPKLRAHLNASLKVRLGLVGSLLDIARQNACQDWCSLLTKLICRGAVDPNHTGSHELYTTTLDMLCSLYRALPSENSSSYQARETRKSLLDVLKQGIHHSTLTNSKCIRELSQLIGVPKPALQIKLFSRYNDHGFHPDDLLEYTLPAWDVLEGFPHSSNLSLAHYLKLLRHEPCPLKYEEQYRLSLLHTHAGKNYVPYSVMLPEVPDTNNTPIQSAISIQDSEHAVNTPNESPTTKKQKRISISSNKDSKRQENLPQYDIKPQISLGNPPQEAGLSMMRSTHPQSQSMYVNRNVPSMQHYSSYQTPQHDKYPMRGYNAEGILGGLDPIAPYSAVNPQTQQQYPMSTRLYPRTHMGNMTGADQLHIPMDQNYMMNLDYGMQPPGANPSINYVPNMQQRVNAQQRQKQYTQVVSRPRMISRPSGVRYPHLLPGSAANNGMNQYSTGMYYDQSGYQRQYSVAASRPQSITQRPSQLLTQPPNPSLIQNQVNYIRD